MAYSKTTWINNSAPAINATNLNKIETGVDEVHDAVENLTTGHDHDGTDSKKVTAADVINVAAGNVVATDVQTAINELDDEKVNKATYDANSILAATTNDTPVVVTVAEQTLVGRITAGNIDDLSVAQAQTLINVENGADVTDATNVNAAGAVMEVDFNANTILAATADDTPLPITISASRLIGRTAASGIEDLTGAEVLTIIGVEAGADVTDATNVAAAGAVMDADFTAADEVMVGTGVGTHGQITLAASEFLAKKAAGAAVNVSASEARTILAVEENADVTDAVNVASSIHGVAAKTTPVDADEVGLIDSAAANVLKKVTWTNIKATLKAYLDTLYAGIGANSDITSMTGLTTPLDEIYGGTGLATYAQGDTVYASGSNVLAKLTKGTATQVLKMNAGATAPEWVGGDVVDDTSPELGGDLDLTSYEILADTTPGTNLTGSGIKGVFTNGNAGSVAFGDLCYMALDGHMEFADADADTSMPGLYMALGTIAAAASGEWMIMGVVRNDTWNWTIGPGASGLIYASVTATTGNTLSQTAPSATGDQVQIVGSAISADIMMFNPSPVLVEIA